MFSQTETMTIVCRHSQEWLRKECLRCNKTTPNQRIVPAVAGIGAKVACIG